MQYINGTAYIRRDLEMPSAVLHHAGTLCLPVTAKHDQHFCRRKFAPRTGQLPFLFPAAAVCASPLPPPPQPPPHTHTPHTHTAGVQAAKLEDLERRLRTDMAAEASMWGGRLLLHREVVSLTRPPTSFLPLGPRPRPPPTSPVRIPAPPAGAPAAHSTLRFVGSPGASAAAGAVPSGMTPPATSAADGGGVGAGAGGEEDITRTTEGQVATRLQTFWESTGLGSGDVELVGGVLPVSCMGSFVVCGWVGGQGGGGVP
jgi:hypothetical protein